ncbi:unnamed protein product [Urochloa humidicola]
MGPAIQRAMEEVMLRYRAEIEAPADAILRKRKASRPSAVHKVAVALSADDDYDTGASAALYREALDGIEPHLPHVAEPPGITTLTLRVSWPCDSTWRNFPRGAYIAGADYSVLALYVGPYRPGLSGVPGFYLVYDSRANSVAVAPPLPPGAVTTFSQCCIGTGVAVLRRRGDGYALVELLPRQDPRSGCITNAGTLFTWRSSGPHAGRWVQTEAAALPLPVEPPDEEDDDEPPGYGFFADTAFAAGGSCVCWADLLQGMLVCDDVLADHPEFRFVPLPPGFSVDPDPEGRRGIPDQYRSMCCVERREVDNDNNQEQHAVKFVAMVGGHSQGRSISEVELVTWTLDSPGDPTSEWKRGAAAPMTLGDIWADPTYKDELGLPPIAPSHPVLSMAQDDVVYLELVEDEGRRLEEEEGDGGVTEGGRSWYMLTVDLRRRRVLSAFNFPPGSRLFPPPDVFATRFTKYLNKQLGNFGEWAVNL